MTIRTRRAIEAALRQGGRTDTDLASDHGVSPTSVAYIRRELGLPSSWERRDFSGVDWSRGDKALAREMGCTRRRVRKERMKRAPSTARPPTGPVDLSAADWSLTNPEVARLCGCSVRTVIRRRPPGTARPRGSQAVVKLRGVDWEQSDRQIARQAGCSPQAVARRRPKGTGRAPGVRYTRAERERLVEWYGFTRVRHLARELGRTEEALRVFAGVLGVAGRRLSRNRPAGDSL